MSELHDHLRDYLRVRRALGYKLERDGYELGRFIDALDARGAETITVSIALEWATRGRGPHSRPKRLRAIRGFARYLDAVGVPVEVPPSDLLPDRRCRAVPYLYGEEEIAALLDAAGALCTPHRAATFRTLIGLLAATGMRRGEAISLDRDDFDPDTGMIVIRSGKFDKARELPLHATTVNAVREYLHREDRPVAVGGDRALLVGDDGRRVSPNVVNHEFRALVRRAGLRPRAAGCRPRAHDLRHTFAVRTLLDAYRCGEPIGPRIVALSTYLGHSEPSHTYWYLEAAPELLALATERLERLEDER